MLEVVLALFDLRKALAGYINSIRIFGHIELKHTVELVSKTDSRRNLVSYVLNGYTLPDFFMDTNDEDKA
jgi:hypothetical protein